jgi:membrane-associated phospholipid phosphatase
MTRPRDLGLAFGSAVAAIVICYLAVDRPLAWFAHDHLKHYAVFVHLQSIADPLVPAATVIALGLGGLVLAGRALARWQMTALVWAVSVLVTAVITSRLKIAFGRTWPETWTANNPSLIRDGAFGFNPFNGGTGFASFPSGHASVMCAAVTVLWIAYPRYRPVYALLVAVTVIGLVGANFHFMSDIVGGGLFGIGVSLVAARLAGLSTGARPAPSAPAEPTETSLNPPARS